MAKAVVPAIVTNYLGDALTPYQDPTQGANLTASPINNLANQFYYLDGTIYYADKATVNQTDLQVFWLTTGVAGLQWPTLLDDHQLVWPSDSTQYSYYLRPATANVVQAALTAVQLDSLESPSLDYYGSAGSTTRVPLGGGCLLYHAGQQPSRPARLM